MDKENQLDFNDIIMKEKRRSDRAKGKRTYDKSKLDKQKFKQKRNNKVIYNPDLDYNDYIVD